MSCHAYEKMMLIYDVIIPVYRPDEKLKRLINTLLSQSLLPRRIILINTEREEFLKFSPEEEFLAQSPLLKLYHISKAEFNHGATRNYGVSLSDAPFFICMTDDGGAVKAFFIGKHWDFLCTTAPGSGLRNH